MTHDQRPRFLVFDEGIINTEDISAVIPYPERTTGAPSHEAGVRVMFMSKATWMDLPSQTIKGFESRLNGAVF